jgi:type III secretion protein J
MSPSIARLALATLCTLVLAGCSEQELYSQLSERQANEMVAVLRSANIAADKKTRDGTFSVVTSAKDFPQAVHTLNAQGYPRESFDTMGKIFKREGFVSTPLEERARLVHAMSQEISNTLASIDGVVTARVHLVVPERHPLIDKPQPAAASVFIKHRPEKDLTGQITSIKAMVVNSIEGLAYEHVTVVLFAAEGLSGESAKPAAPAAAPLTPEQAQRDGLTQVLLAGGGVGALAFVGGGLLWWLRRRPADAEAPAAAGLGHSAPAAALPKADPGAPLQAAQMQAALARAMSR